MSGKVASSRRWLSDLEARVLFVIRRDPGAPLTHEEITERLAGHGYEKRAGYIRRVVKKLEDAKLLERNMKPGPTKLVLAFSIPRDTMNSRRVTSLILLQLMSLEILEDQDSPERDEFIEKLLDLKLSKKSGKLLTRSEIEKAIEFCEANGYIENLKAEGTIRVAARTEEELPFIKLMALGDEPATQAKDSTAHPSDSKRGKRSGGLKKRPMNRIRQVRKDVAS
jgi:hypothetical protein